jgi:methylase of polypeptide subunit release factors
MSNIIRSTTQTALLFISQYLHNGDTVVDATCGNGHDTLALAKMGAGKIYAFDVQETAITNTESLLIKENIPLSNVHLILDSHANMCNYIKEKVQVIVFNLGYLPSADKSIITSSESTITAVKEAMKLLKKDGLICISMYSGHPGGQEEKQSLLDFAESLDERTWHTAYINMRNQRKNPPEILLITLKRGVEFEEN